MNVVYTVDFHLPLCVLGQPDVGNFVYFSLGTAVILQDTWLSEM
jgi:hypothetical protein